MIKLHEVTKILYCFWVFVRLYHENSSLLETLFILIFRVNSKKCPPFWNNLKHLRSWVMATLASHALRDNVAQSWGMGIWIDEFEIVVTVEIFCHNNLSRLSERCVSPRSLPRDGRPGERIGVQTDRTIGLDYNKLLQYQPIMSKAG